MIWPSVVAHADWGVDRAKRQMALASLDPGGIGAGPGCGAGPGYMVSSLAPAAEGQELFDGIQAAARPGQALVGFDFPIGLPRKYAAAAGITSFPGFLAALGAPPWDEFHLVAARPAEITLHRPFYPASPGGTRREHQYQALRLAGPDLRRRCEGTDAEILFWTLGGKQAGKGALAGWQLIAAARRRDQGISLWPFDGTLPGLLAGGDRVVVAEAYPREYYRYLGPLPGPGRWSKRRREDRLRRIPGLLSWASSLGVRWDAAILDRAESGFSAGKNGEDEFDAVIGLLAMIGVITGSIDAGAPPGDRAVPSVEGWILGRAGYEPPAASAAIARLAADRTLGLSSS
jgi:hypothetical protein